jgi:tRNA 2-selenouridine synthase SelU
MPDEKKTVDFEYHRNNETEWIGKLCDAEDRASKLEDRLAAALTEIRRLRAIEAKRIEQGSCPCQRASRTATSP